jgi:hypothetical protein
MTALNVDRRSDISTRVIDQARINAGLAGLAQLADGPAPRSR